MKADFYVKISGKKRYANWSLGHVQAFKTKPATDEQEVAVKFSIDIPDEVFDEPIYEAKLTLPKITRQLPEVSEITKALQTEMSKKLGFKVKIDIVPPTPPV